MRKAKVYVKGIEAGMLSELVQGKEYVLEYLEEYKGLEVSRTMPITQKVYKFNNFPPFFDGLLPEGIQLEGLLKIKKIEDIINSIKEDGKIAYIYSNEDDFRRIYHDYSKKADGFIKWKGELESYLL